MTKQTNNITNTTTSNTTISNTSMTTTNVRPKPKQTRNHPRKWTDQEVANLTNINQLWDGKETRDELFARLFPNRSKTAVEVQLSLRGLRISPNILSTPTEVRVTFNPKWTPTDKPRLEALIADKRPVTQAYKDYFPDRNYTSIVQGLKSLHVKGKRQGIKRLVWDSASLAIVKGLIEGDVTIDKAITTIQKLHPDTPITRRKVLDQVRRQGGTTPFSKFDPRRVTPEVKQHREQLLKEYIVSHPDATELQATKELGLPIGYTRENLPSFRRALNIPKPQRKGHTWTQQDTDFLLANYPKITNYELAEAIGASYANVALKKRELGITNK